MTHATRALQSHDMSGEGINYLMLLFWAHRDMEGLPGLVISSMPGPPLRQQKDERWYTPSTHPFILTRRIWKDDYDGQMIFGDHVGLTLPDTWGKPPNKTSHRKLIPTGDRTRARCLIGANATACSTAVNGNMIIKKFIKYEVYNIQNKSINFLISSPCLVNILSLACNVVNCACVCLCVLMPTHYTIRCFEVPRYAERWR